MMGGCVRVMCEMVLAAVLSMGLADVSARTCAEEKPPVERQRSQYLAQMKSLAEATNVTYKGDQQPPKLVSTPIFRYDDQPRRFIDATMWVWTDGGYPVAFQKVEAMINRGTNMPQWGYCFTSVSTNLLQVTWSADRQFESKEPGIVFQRVVEAPEVAERDATRKRQARELARTFSARVVIDPKRNDKQELRLLTTPIFEYSDPHTSQFMGAVFGFSANGTNPDLLILFEPRKGEQKMEWYFAPARMTSGGVTLSYRDKKVWETPFVNAREAPFATWTFFQTPRIPLAEK